MEPSEGPFEAIRGLEQIREKYDAMLIDAWGVMHDGERCYPGVVDCLRRLREHGISVLVLSNAARRQAALQDELSRVGIGLELYREALSSGELAWQALASGRLPFAARGRGYYLGPARSRGLCDGLEIEWTGDPEHCDFVLDAGAPEGNPGDAEIFTPLLQRMLSRRLPMICANPDQLAVRAGVPGISAGAIARLYQRMGADRVVYFGKPQPEIFARAQEVLGGVERRRILMIGDAFATDIAGAAGFGIDSLLIAGGIHAAELANGGQVRLYELAAEYAARPTYLCTSLRWQEPE